MPKRIQVRVQDTLDGLDTGTRLLLETTAALGRSFRLEDAAMLLGKSPAALLPAVDQALAATVLVAKQDQLSFRHELVWQAISTALPLPIRQALHRQIAEMLLARGSAASAAAHLLSRARAAGQRGAGWAGPGCRRGSALIASAIAADLAARALELTPPGIRS